MKIKIEIGSASPMEKPLVMQVRGRDQVSGLLNTLTLS